jgi:uncharacterized membrane protein YdcZ (DUF606 family)
MNFKPEEKKMQPPGLVVLVCLISGIAVAVQASFAGLLSERIGLIGNGPIVFGGGFLFALILFLVFQEDQIIQNVYDLEAFKPKPEWQQKYDEVKREARELDLPLDS